MSNDRYPKFFILNFILNDMSLIEWLIKIFKIVHHLRQIFKIKNLERVVLGHRVWILHLDFINCFQLIYYFKISVSHISIWVPLIGNEQIWSNRQQLACFSQMVQTF